MTSRPEPVRLSGSSRHFRRYVLTGGVGFGKTTLIRALAERTPFDTRSEIAEEMIAKELANPSGRLPWQNRDAFEPLLLERRIEAFERPTRSPVVFFDRGIPDGIAFFRSDGLEAPDSFHERARRYRYDDPVLLLPPWPEIFETSEIRPQSLAESVQLGELLEAIYRELGYEVVSVPQGTLEARVDFVRAVCGPRLRESGAESVTPG